jgi:hypothetical protein
LTPGDCAYEIRPMNAPHFARGAPKLRMRKIAASPSMSRWLIMGGAVTTLALAGTASLWAHFGTVVFFETIRTGFAACFG